MKLSTVTDLIVSLSGGVLAAPTRDAADAALLEERRSNMKAGGFAPPRPQKRAAMHAMQAGHESGLTPEINMGTKRAAGGARLESRAQSAGASGAGSALASDQAMGSMVGRSIDNKVPATVSKMANANNTASAGMVSRDVKASNMSSLAK